MACRPTLVTACAIASLFLLTGSIHAQSFAPILHFGEDSASRPFSSLLEASDGYLYGTTNSTVFKLPKSGERVGVITLHVFTGADGASPRAALIQADDGFLYGTTSRGGPADAGTVYRMDTTGALEVLHAFGGVSGSSPEAALLQASDGFLYGTTAAGGAFGYGTVFRMDRTGAVTVLHAFDGPTTGASPAASLIEARDGFLYGTTQSGGPEAYGTAFRMDRAGSVTVVAAFDYNLTIGGVPRASLIEGDDGAFYSTTTFGGIYLYGAAFRMTRDGAVTVLHAFDGSTGHPFGMIEATDGSFYGTTSGSVTALSTIFRMDRSGTVSVLQRFGTTSPYDPFGRFADLIQATDGFLYGTHPFGVGDVSEPGIAFRMDVSGAVGVLHEFGRPSPTSPFAEVLQASDGLLYGTTRNGGAANLGTVFRMDPTGASFTLSSFDEPGLGINPSQPLIDGRDGFLYGTTPEGGNGFGTVFRISREGALTALHEFDGTTAGVPQAGLTLASNGGFFGTTYSGGTLGYGTVFRMDATGALDVLHSFDGVTTGAGPVTELVEGDDGLLYGATSSGGPGGFGTAFRLDPGGALAVLREFDASTGSPTSLMEASDGFFYGTTVGPTAPLGTVFRMDRSGALTVLHRFSGGVTGGSPYATVLEATDGFLYGTASVGGAHGLGTVFRLSRTGAISVVHAFDGPTGAYPFAGLIEADDGRLYGTASGGGRYGGGVVFGVDLLGVRVVAPNGGESLVAGVPATIRWTATGAPTGFDVELSRDDGATFEAIAGCTGLTGSTTECTWTPDGPRTKRARVRVTTRGLGGASVYDTSDAHFTIAAAVGRIRVVAPHAKTRWTIGSTQTIRWHDNLGAGARVAIELSRDRGHTWNKLGSVEASASHRSGTFTWVVTGPPTTKAVVRVRWLDGPVSDVSRGTFSIVRRRH